MGTVVRDDVSTPYSRCIDCGVKTRSHVLEPAEYEIYKGEGILGSSDVYASEGWEEVEEVDKYDLWMDKTVLHAAEIKKAVNTQIAYDFEDDKTILALKNLARQLKEAALDG